MIVNRAKLSEIVGIAPQSLDSWIRQGMPFVKKPGEQGDREWQFKTSEVIAWRETCLRERLSAGKSADINEARLRKLDAEAEAAEIELEQRKKSLIRVEDVERGIHELLSNVKTKMLGVPDKLAPYINPGTMEILKNEIHAALEETSKIAL